jgi:hypothetical protein
MGTFFAFGSLIEENEAEILDPLETSWLRMHFIQNIILRLFPVTVVLGDYFPQFKAFISPLYDCIEYLFP